MNTFEIPLRQYLRANNNRLCGNKNIILKEGNLHYFLSNPTLKTILAKGREDEIIELDGVSGQCQGEIKEGSVMDATIILPIEILKECDC